MAWSLYDIQGEPISGGDLFVFPVTDSFDEIVENMEHDQRLSLDEPSGLFKVKLCIDWWNQTYRELDLSGTTNEKAIKKILRFYQNKTFKRGIGDHIFCEGFYPNSTIHLGS